MEEHGRALERMGEHGREGEGEGATRSAQAIGTHRGRRSAMRFEKLANASASAYSLKLKVLNESTSCFARDPTARYL